MAAVIARQVEIGKEVMDAGNMCTAVAKRWRERLRLYLYVVSGISCSVDILAALSCRARIELRTSEAQPQSKHPRFVACGKQ
jgi:hypothetical protein